MKTILDNRGLLFCYEKETNTYIIEHPQSTLDIYPNMKKQIEFENPIEAWRSYSNCLDSLICRLIGDMLEAQGKNRFTGGN